MVLNSPWGTVDTTSPAYRVGLLHGLLSAKANTASTTAESTPTTLALQDGEPVTNDEEQSTTVETAIDLS